MCFGKTNRRATNSVRLTICLFIIRFRQKLFRCKLTNISFEFRQKTASPTKRWQRKIDSPKWRITIYTLFAFRLLFVVSSVFRHYLWIVYRGLKEFFGVSWLVKLPFRKLCTLTHINSKQRSRWRISTPTSQTNKCSLTTTGVFFLQVVHKSVTFLSCSHIKLAVGKLARGSGPLELSRRKSALVKNS